MKKTFNISIAKTLFILEEDAYAKLDAYLSSIREHFNTTPAKEEIIADIEARIAEQLLETRESVITLTTVEQIMKKMGNIEDFDDAETTAPQKTKKRLYRDVDNKIIAGVCSGVAEFLNINVLWVRIIFVVLALSNAIGVILYIVLWVVLPEAKTMSQKLEMEGSPVTLETLRAAANDSAQTIQRSGGKVVLMLRNLVQGIGGLLRILIGSILVIGTGMVMAGFMVGSGFILSNTAWVADDIPLSSLLPGPQYWVVLIGMVLAVILVLFCILLAGVSILKRKKVIEPWVGFGIFGIWLITLLISGYGIAQITNNYREAIAVSPAYQNTTREMSFADPIQTLVIEDRMRVKVVEGVGTTSTLTVVGQQNMMDRYNAEYTNGILHISQQENKRAFCLLCHSESPELTLITPSLSALQLRNGASVYSESLPTNSPFTISLERGSYGDLVLHEDAATISVSNSSRLQLRGTATSSEMTVENASRIDADNFRVQSAKLSARERSYAEVNALQSLDITARNGSEVRYVGDPQISENADISSDISPL